VINIALPPLVDRPLDILPLAESFLSAGKRLGESARRALQAHSWPGNVRELKNAITRGCLLSAGEELDPGALGLQAIAVTRAEEEPDRSDIEQALATAGGVVAQAAQSLGLSRQALYRRMERLGIDR
jgi:DNA-binding NtrC family response regulator